MIKILDCTLRDGGYYNDWHFDKNFVENYLLSASKNNIDIVELGFRFIKYDPQKGPYAYSDEKFINSLKLPHNLKYAVMINADEYISDPELIKKKFIKKNKSNISLVRIAINFDKAPLGKQITIELKKLGYDVGFNLMQPHDKKNHEYENIGKVINKWKTVDILYFADSLGCLNPESVVNIIKKLKINWKKKIGFHPHDNRRMALANSLKAIETKSLQFIDSTMTGMGRGAGNLQTEVILSELDKLNGDVNDINFFLDTLGQFDILKNQFNWGSNLFYQLGANKKVHPSYIQNLLSDKRYSSKEIYKIITKLGKKKSSSYSLENLHSIIFSKPIKKKLTLDRLFSKEILIIGNGVSVKDNQLKIKNFLHNNKKIKSFFLNINQYIPNSLGSGTIISHPSRLVFDRSKYLKLKKYLIMPSNNIIKNKDFKQNSKLIKYDIKLDKNKFISNETYCKIPSSLVLAYALAFTIQLQVERIYFIGIDGLETDTKKNIELNKILQLFKKQYSSINITSLTKSKLNIKYKKLLV